MWKKIYYHYSETETSTLPGLPGSEGGWRGLEALRK
jgi:hypothetical protein